MANVKYNSDFLFLYDATMCNPNGDPDQENKPRMDYATKTNLVSDVRLKRYIRDYLKDEGNAIFVDMEGDSKVSPDSKLKHVLSGILSNEEERKKLFSEKPNMEKTFNDIVEQEKEGDNILRKLQEKKGNKQLNYYILSQLVKQKFIDIRMFGSAFAIEAFTRSYTGAIQVNWGYSLNQVELVESPSIVTIMSDDSSTFGKDYRLYYSLLAFSGTINKHAAKSTGLTEKDLGTFRTAIWNSIPSQPTRSKINQYPKLYLEIVYNDGFNNGHFGDLRNYVKLSYKEGIPAKMVRKFDDLTIDVSELSNLIQDGKKEKDLKDGQKEKIIKDVIIKRSADFPEIKID